MAYIDSEIKVPEVKCWYPLTIVYDPIKNGSIDGTDVEPHDAGIVRALNSRYKSNYKAKGNPEHTIFVGRLSLDTTEDDLEKVKVLKLLQILHLKIDVMVIYLI